jgi:hypothetical protein
MRIKWTTLEVSDELLRGHRAVSPEMALRLARLFIGLDSVDQPPRGVPIRYSELVTARTDQRHGTGAERYCGPTSGPCRLSWVGSWATVK